MKIKQPNAQRGQSTVERIKYRQKEVVPKLLKAIREFPGEEEVYEVFTSCRVDVPNYCQGMVRIVLESWLERLIYAAERITAISLPEEVRNILIELDKFDSVIEKMEEMHRGEAEEENWVSRLMHSATKVNKTQALLYTSKNVIKIAELFLETDPSVEKEIKEVLVKALDKKINLLKGVKEDSDKLGLDAEEFLAKGSEKMYELMDKIWDMSKEERKIEEFLAMG